MDHLEDCRRAARLFRTTFDQRSDADDIRELERLTAWAEDLCRSGCVSLEFAAKTHGPNLRLIPVGRGPESLFQIYNYHHGHAKPGVGIYLYSHSHANLAGDPDGFKARWWSKRFPSQTLSRVEAAQTQKNGLTLKHPSEALLADVAELLRLASSPAPSCATTVPYQPRNENVRASPASVWSRDPDKFDRATSAHRRLENELARLAEERGLDPRDHSRREWDLAWIDKGTLTIVEVKSTTPENETRQLRLGVGQLLDYKTAAAAEWPEVNAVLTIERPPGDKRWIRLCREHGIRLVWPESFEGLFD